MRYDQFGKISVRFGSNFKSYFSISFQPLIAPAINGEYAWIFVQDIGLCKYELFKNKFVLINDDITRGNFLKEDKYVNLWMGNNNGLYQYNALTNSYLKFFD